MEKKKKIKATQNIDIKGEKATNNIKLEGNLKDIEGSKVSISQRNLMRENKMFQRFFTINQDFLLYISKLKLNGNESRILFYLLGKMERDNIIILDNHLIAEDLEMLHTNVSRDLKSLSEKEIIIKKDRGNKRQGRGFEIRFNPIFNDFMNPSLGFKAQNNEDNVLAHIEAMKIYSPYEQVLTKETIEYRVKKTKEVFSIRPIPIKKQKQTKKRSENKKATVKEDNKNNEPQDWPQNWNSTLSDDLKKAERKRIQKDLFDEDVLVNDKNEFEHF